MISLKPIDVFPGSKRLVKGAVPSASLLLMGPTGVGKTTFCKQFIYNGLIMGEPCLYVATDESPEEIQKSMKSFGFDIEPYKEKETFRIVDCYSWRLGGGSSSKYAVDDQHDYLTAVSISIEKARQGLRNIRLVLDSITGLTAFSSQDAVSKFLQIVTARILSLSGKAIFTVASGAHNDQFMSFLRLTFDGTLEMKIDETGNEIKRLLRIFSLKGVKHRTSWTPFEITDGGINMKSEAELRCVMCSKLIEWEPHIETIDGEKYQFDTMECVNTYKKLKSFFKYFE